jgi:SAM-dependent methyltransferase
MGNLGEFSHDYNEQFYNLISDLPGGSIELVPTTPLIQFSILARNAEYFLDLYLDCLSNLDYDKSQIILHIQTNDNVDATEDKINQWLSLNAKFYYDVQYHSTSFKTLEDDKTLTWSNDHFDVIKKLRNKTLESALHNNVDYLFICDVDNFIIPSTLKNLVGLGLPIVAPLLRFDTAENLESNFWPATDSSGLWFNENQFYGPIISRYLQGVFKLPLVHCTYLIKADCIASLTYSNLFSESSHEYIVFADNARRQQIPMYLDNRLLYGLATSLDLNDKKLLSERISDLRSILSKTWENLDKALQKNAQDTFNEIYRTSHWGQGSGSGSLPENAQEWIHNVNQLIRERKITSIIDVGCGDFQLGQQYNLAGINYLGVDVSDLIISKNSVYENSKIKFRSINAELFEFPKTDLILIKDVFQHLPNASIVRIMEKIVESAPYILICNDIINLDEPNNDIEVGGWRGLDLLKDPFNFDLQSVCQYESGLEIKQIYLFSRTKI